MANTSTVQPVVAFYDLAALHASMADELADAVGRTIAGNHLVLGPEGEAFEAEFAAYCGAGHGIGVGTGLDALTLGMLAMGIGPGDQVIVPGQTFIATWLAVTATGASPIPADVDIATGQIDPVAVEAAITSSTAAIIAVHLFGDLAPMSALRAIATRHGLALIEDAAQAHGARYGTELAGGLSDLAAFSFYPGKNLGALGDGGLVVTNDDGVARWVRRLRNYGSIEKYQHDVIGTNSRLDEIQAAVLRVKLPRLEIWNERRRAIAERYRTQLGPVEGIEFAEPRAGTVSAAHLLPIRIAERDAVRVRLAEMGIETGVHYPTPPHRSGAYAGRYDWHCLQNSNLWAGEELSLPIGPTMSDAEVDRVCIAIADAVAQ
jgi:dTDP-3-amino-3,4,6-trideoxy-alpha-D-glucose transaminase